MSRHISIGLALFAVPACVMEATDPIDTATTGQSIVGGQLALPADFPTVVALENSPVNCSAQAR